VIVLRPGALGDTLLALPALRALRWHFRPVRLAAHAGAARLLAELGEVDQGLAFDDPELGWVFREAPPTEPVVAWMHAAGAPALRWALLVAPARPADEEHAARYLVRTLSTIGIEPAEIDDSPLRVAPVASEEVLVHVGSGSPRKNWPAERFAAVIRAVDGPVRLIVGEADALPVRALDALLGYRVPRLEQVPLDELVARLAGCRAYLGNDSGVSHLAGLSGAPSVVLFGPTSPSMWRPLGPAVTVERFDVSTERVVALLQGLAS
jgi:ADP-heptose:LPS heptosyltransferase